MLTKCTRFNATILAIAAITLSCECHGEELKTLFGEVYAQRESGPLKADIYLAAQEGPNPCVLVLHGGAWCMGTRVQLAGFAKMLADNGMTAVAITYRLAPDHIFPAQIEDCKEAVRWIRKNADRLKIDPARVGAFGYSAGAHLAALLGTTDAEDGLEGVAPSKYLPSTRLQAVAGGGIPCDFRTIDPDNRGLAFWLGGSRREFEDRYSQASPRAHVSADDPPMFFFHGENDDLVPMISPKMMCQSLKDVGVEAEYYVVPKIGHVFAMYDQKALDMSVAFLAKKLALDSN